MKTAIAGVGAREVPTLSEAGVVIVTSLERAVALVKQAPGRPVLLCAKTDALATLTKSIEAGVFDLLPLPLDWGEVGRRIVRALNEVSR